MIKWDDLPNDQREQICLMAGFSDKTSDGLATLEWSQLEPEIRDKLFFVNWFFVAGIQTR